MIGQLVGHYRVLEKIGAGGMGEVFRARDERLGRDVALKLIRPGSSQNPEHLRRFEQEARAAAALNHPNILAIYDVGFEGTNPYIVSELLEGKTLRTRLSDGPLPVIAGRRIYAIQIAQGLSAAHERHIVHRDLKPENLFLTQDDRIKILDFGVAKLQPSADQDRSVESMTTVTKHGAVVGTVAYMSPEQLRGKTVDHRSDIFSFGAILYEMMSGQRAFRGETEVDTMTAVLREEPPSASLEQAAIPTPYQDVVRHCLEKEPENRFQSAKDLVFALQTISGSSPVKVKAVPDNKEKSTTFASLGRGRDTGDWRLCPGHRPTASRHAAPDAGLSPPDVRSPELFIQRASPPTDSPSFTARHGTISQCNCSLPSGIPFSRSRWNSRSSPARHLAKQRAGAGLGGSHTGQLETS